MQRHSIPFAYTRIVTVRSTPLNEMYKPITQQVRGTFFFEAVVRLAPSQNLRPSDHSVTQGNKLGLNPSKNPPLYSHNSTSALTIGLQSSRPRDKNFAVVADRWHCEWLMEPHDPENDRDRQVTKLGESRPGDVSPLALSSRSLSATLPTLFLSDRSRQIQCHHCSGPERHP